MKNLLSHLLPCVCLLLALCACRPHAYPPLLGKVDGLLDAGVTDRAYALLDSMAADMQEERKSVQTYYRLLRVKADDKSFVPHTSDTVILPILHYCQQRPGLPYRAEAFYYAGRVYCDLGDTPRALDYFEKALEVLDKEEGKLLESLIHSQMGTLFMSQNLYREALLAYRKSLRCDSLRGDKQGMIYDYRDIGGAYLSLEQADSALHYYNKSYRLCEMLGEIVLGYMVQSQLASLYVQQGEYPAAHASLDLALRDTLVIDRSGVYSVAALYYRSVNRLDSAKWYYRELLKYGTVYSKEWANRGLAQMALTEGDIVPASRYLSQALLLWDSIQSGLNTKEVGRIHSLYNYRLYEKENKRLVLENERKNWVAVIACGLSFTLLCILIVCYMVWRKKTHQRRQTIEQLQERIYRNSRAFIEEKKLVFEELADEIKDLEHQLHDSQINYQCLVQEKELLACTIRRLEEERDRRLLESESFFGTELHQALREKERSGQKICKEDWGQLEGQLDLFFDNFSQKIKNLGNLKEQEIHVCLLVKAGFANKSIAQFIMLSPEAVTSIRRRLAQKILGQDKGAKDWDDFVRSL